MSMGALLLAGSAHAAPRGKLVKDINPGKQSAFYSDEYVGAANIGKTLYFGASDGTHGVELVEVRWQLPADVSRQGHRQDAGCKRSVLRHDQDSTGGSSSVPTTSGFTAASSGHPTGPRGERGS